ncbi:MAG TPA: DEAD/DEAH box helicase family protein [Candidatus Baltobacteraceae bacterium]|nr:DEAD/DEAH box helicase family protein [Candidatus Baltobacteraceae bacterium]
MPRLHIEKVLQKELVRELTERGWDEGVGSKEAGRYDRKRALYTQDVLTWLKATESAEYAKVQAMHNGETDEKLLKRLSDVLEQRGTIDVLRNGFDYLNAHFPMCASKPNSTLNPSEAVRYDHVMLRVVQELEYSDNNEKRLDLGFFVNGIAVATSEMKTENTQTIDDAVRQYCEDRPPKDPKTKKEEPLLKWKRGAIVHFAISSREVRMTTKLEGPKTNFLPFNQGNHGGAGNPAESGINYMWEQVLNRDAFLDILGNFVCMETRKKIEGGEIVRKQTLLFPRYHQWDAVTKMVAAAKAEGAGQRYLIQHSAGSGKSNTIMWTAHRLANLHDAADKRVFDTTFVVTDRTVLDDQLADTVKQFDNKAGVIARIDGEKATKTAQLKDALGKGVPIIIVTIQTFPFVLDSIQGSQEWQGRKFAIIADEAHSSQTGTTAQKVRELLGVTDEEGDLTLDDDLAARAELMAHPKNLSYFAFTATPKPRTIEIFGRKGPDGKPAPFHSYTMRQAIEEGFILDVLQNYMTYEAAYRVATSEGENIVPKGETAKLIARMQQLHTYTIHQKIIVIVSHFRETIAKELNGHAKAMIVTDSREAAVRYKKQIDAHFAEMGYTNLKALVAFSGELSLDKDFPGTYRESTMNNIGGVDIPEAFDTDEYQVLIVAEKYQTGFDQPLLCGMYVDKKLEKLAAVQTLSRLNRTYKGPFGTKTAAFILDFVNDQERIKEAFLPYFETAEIDAPTDPNVVYDLAKTIDEFGVPHLYTANDIETFGNELFAQGKSDSQKQTALNNLIAPVADRYTERLRKAQDEGDSEEVSKGTIFRKNLTTFVRLYRFLSQIYNFESLDIAKREAFYEWLGRNIREKQTGERPDISGVQLTHFSLKKTFEGTIELAGKKMLETGDGAGSAVARVKSFAPLREVIDLMNEFFGSTITEENQIRMVAGVFERGTLDSTLAAQARNNPHEKFAIGDAASRIKTWMTETYLDAVDKNSENTRQMGEIKTILSEDDKFEAFSKAMIRALYDSLAKAPTPPGSNPG